MVVIDGTVLFKKLTNIEDIKLDICIYHGNCIDGFGGAFACWQKHGDSIDYHQGIFKEPPPDVTNKHVVIIDFSYDKETMIEMATKAKTITILDHHETAQQELQCLIDDGTIFGKFDTDKSGCVLAWEHFLPNKPIPEIYKYIQDYDTLSFQKPQTKEIVSSLFSYTHDFKVWEYLIIENLDVFYKEGVVIVRKQRKELKELLTISTRKMKIAGHVVDVANLPYTFSHEASMELASDNPFGACYYDTHRGRVFSLRSHQLGEDVAKVAEQYGGGGHPTAAGFTISFDDAKVLEVEDHEIQRDKIKLISV